MNTITSLTPFATAWTGWKKRRMSVINILHTQLEKMTRISDAGKTKHIKLHACRVLSSPTSDAIAVWVQQKQ